MPLAVLATASKRLTSTRLPKGTNLRRELCVIHSQQKTYRGQWRCDALAKRPYRTTEAGGLPYRGSNYAPYYRCVELRAKCELIASTEGAGSIRCAVLVEATFRRHADVI
ncbi:hypothetical protein F444_20008 [Phytophthora nicotianae P1976]|uniref:Uncharacterized protein n=1 Tax=Phytophthora nicotianae P1976 TaxID=1317066 RepID=A0A080Z603_PHYNI|nr:hypothetical protein F444_20008 [Phytophthora nicotianae P1976]